MVDILPFKGLIYNPSKIPDISYVISPPYDVISPQTREMLYKLSPYNIIRLILPEEKNHKNRYDVAKNTLEQWIEQEIFITDNKKSFYIFEESYVSENRIKKLFGFMGLTKTEPYSASRIFPHEKTMTLPKQDRLSLLRSCRTNFEPVYTIYDDPQKELLRIFEAEANKKPPFITTNAQYDPSLKFKLWKVTEPITLEKIVTLMKVKKLLIADGHHRYETSLAYKNETKNEAENKPCSAYKPEDYVLTLYIDSSQEGVNVLPVHRLIKFKSYRGVESTLHKISPYFSIDAFIISNSMEISEKLYANKLENKKSFYIYFKEKKGYLVTLKTNVKELCSRGEKVNIDYIDYENLDVNIVHNLLLNKLLDKQQIEKIEFSHSISEVIKEVNSNLFDIAIIVNPLSIKEIEKLAFKGILMPEKSTYFHPKPCSGLVMYKFDVY